MSTVAGVAKVIRGVTRKRPRNIVSSKSIVVQSHQQNPELKKMEDDRKQKGGKKLEQNTALDIPEDIYLDYCTPDESETMSKRKIRLQKIECRWAKEWKEYRFVTPKYAKKFTLKPPGKRAPLEAHQVAHPSSLKTLDDYPDENDKHLPKLKKQADAALRKYNESSAAASTATTSSAAETSGSTIPQQKSVPSKPKASKPQEKPTLASATKPSVPKPSAPKSTASPQVSKPELEPVMKPLPATSSSSLPAATTSETKYSPPPVKTQVSAERGTQPSPRKIITVPSASEGSDEYDDETLQAIIKNKQERVAQASGSAIPLAMDPKVLLDYINIWYEDPNTPLDDLKLPPGISHMVATFINEAKWKEQQAKQAKIAKLKKEKFLKQNLLNLTPDALVSTQAELKTLTDKYSKLYDHQSLKSSFIKFATKVVDDYNKKAAPPVPTPQPLIEELADESPQADETPQAEEIPQESRVDVPAIVEITTENPADESATGADESVERTPSPKASKVKKKTPTASNVKKTRAAENEAKKRKVSSAEENTEAKCLKALEDNAPLDPVPLNVAPSYEMVTFEDQEKGPDEEMKDVASEEHTDEEIRIDDSPQPSVPQATNAQGSAPPADDSGSVTKQAEEEQSEIPQADEIQSPEKNPQIEDQADPTPPPEQDLLTQAQNEPIPSPEQNPQQDAAPDAQADEIPHPEDDAEENAPDQDNAFVVLNPETAIVVSPPVPSQNLQPMQCQPFSKRPKFQKENFFEERMYFIGENPYDKPQIRHLKFWTRTQLNYYASVLCGRNKIIQHMHIPHVELEAIPWLVPVLNFLHEAGLLPMCSDISDWNSEPILQFYATLHICGDPEDINTWVFDWMTQNTHYKAPATELLRELPVSIPSEEAVKLYGERELPNGMMEVLMKPLAKGQPPRKTFLVHELKYKSRSVYRILCIVLAPIKGHDDEEDVVGLLKNILFNIIHGIPINIHDFFLRTLADNAMCTFDHKIYAPWIMRFIKTRTCINFHADFNNHVGYMPPIRVNKKTFGTVEGKGKSVIDEGRRPLDGQFREPEAYSSWDDTETHPQSPVAPRVLNTRELLLSLHQKVDHNHKWVKRQFGAIVKTLTETQNSVKLNHHYLHEVFDRTWATLAHLKTQTELEELEFERDFD
ncbi:hypothetical protein ZWY2020_052415 [Hordeum vulgare]|nr:hypothetical protein ZWY2020_052415 [Hordeum vulgare]